ncbi:MAG: hypothetical protein JSS46_16710 [Proteobacteria bacterium]|jgi:hypothetical protein|nr:hypothetical protein [Pseudomonadota bacterium]
MSALDTHRDERAGDWLDRALAQRSAGDGGAYIDDAGFTARVLARLPAVLEPVRWRRPVLLLLWALAIAGLAMTLPHAVLDGVREVVRLFVGKPFALSDIASAVALTGIAMWTATWLAWRRA